MDTIATANDATLLESKIIDTERKVQKMSITYAQMRRKIDNMSGHELKQKAVVYDARSDEFREVTLFYTSDDLEWPMNEEEESEDSRPYMEVK